MTALAFLIASAQLQVPPTVPPTVGVAPGYAEPQEQPLLQNDLIMRAGTDRIFYSGSDYAVSPAVRGTLAAQARWLIANPSVRAIVEGHGDDRDTRDHAFAIGERRAAAVRDYLVSLGVPAARLSVASWGKERPVLPLPGIPNSGPSARVVLVIVR